MGYDPRLDKFARMMLGGATGDVPRPPVPITRTVNIKAVNPYYGEVDMAFADDQVIVPGVRLMQPYTPDLVPVIGDSAILHWSNAGGIYLLGRHIDVGYQDPVILP